MPQKKNNSNNSEKPQNAYFLSLELENVRCFGEKQKIDFSDANGNPKQWTIILGDNGTGKTTILRILVGLAPKAIESESKTSSNGELEIKTVPNFTTIPYMIDVWNGKKGQYYSSQAYFSVKSNLTKFSVSNKNNESFTIDGNYHNSVFFVLNEVSTLISLQYFAYGASRPANDNSLISKRDTNTYATLFENIVDIINAEEWLLRSDYAASKESKFQEQAKVRLEKVKEILIKILPEIDSIRFIQTAENITPRVEFKTPFDWVDLRDLSLGYRSTISWIVDFASRMFDLYPESENPLAEPAVVLIDEIDLHLHPKWQRELLDYLSNLFPNTQFIVTTHSPLIVQSAAARDANIVVCRREGDHVVIDQSVEAVKNWRADQILTSDLFGLETSRPKEIEKDLLERQAILSKAKLTKKDEKRLTELEEKIGSVPVMENPKYDEAMDIIFRAAEKLEKKNGSPK